MRGAVKLALQQQHAERTHSLSTWPCHALSLPLAASPLSSPPTDMPSGSAAPAEAAAAASAPSFAPSLVPDGLTEYSGGCHCGAVSFRLHIAPDEHQVLDCKSDRQCETLDDWSAAKRGMAEAERAASADSLTVASPPWLACLPLSCSICTKKGFLHLIVTPDRFNLLSGQEQLQLCKDSARAAEERRRAMQDSLRSRSLAATHNHFLLLSASDSLSPSVSRHLSDSHRETLLLPRVWHQLVLPAPLPSGGLQRESSLPRPL